MTSPLKLLFFSLTLISSMVTFSSINWFSAWMGLEMNLLTFIPLMKYKNMKSTQSMIKYFLIQAISSSIFLLSMLLMMNNMFMMNEMYTPNMYLVYLMNMPLLMKLGAAPFHFWVPNIIEGLNWLSTLILLSWQKIAPMSMLYHMMKLTPFIMFIAILSILIGSIMGLNQTKLKMIIVYSSINHMGWMISSFLSNKMMWINYFFIYILILTPICLIFNLSNSFNLTQMYTLMPNSLLLKTLFSLNFISLGGLPPFLGFYPKWMLIQSLSNYKFMIFIMMLMTLMTLFYYIQIIYSSLFLSSHQITYNMTFYHMKNNSIIITIILSFSALTLFMINFNLI